MAAKSCERSQRSASGHAEHSLCNRLSVRFTVPFATCPAQWFLGLHRV